MSYSYHPVDCSPPDSSVHGILQARILECVAFPSLGDLPDPGIKPGSPASQADAREGWTHLNQRSSLEELSGIKMMETDILSIHTLLQEDFRLYIFKTANCEF